MHIYDEAQRAELRIRPHVAVTPVRRSAWLSRETGAEVWLKLENVQPTGSFKLRGAMNKLLGLEPGERRAGVVAASSGNHGAAVAWGAEALGIPCTVFVPSTVPEAKRAAIAGLGAQVEVFGDDCALSESHARATAQAAGRCYVSPYNDPAVIAGQGTVALELTRQVPALDAVFVALGGGGLTGGIAAVLAAISPGTQVIACSPEASAVMQRSVEAGRILELPSEPTLSDSTAGGVEADALTFPLCQQLVARFVTVPEVAIARAMRRVLGEEHLLIEGAAGVAVAGLLGEGAAWRGRRVGVVLCGSNVSPERLLEVLSSSPPTD